MLLNRGAQPYEHSSPAAYAAGAATALQEKHIYITPPYNPNPHPNHVQPAFRCTVRIRSHHPATATMPAALRTLVRLRRLFRDERVRSLGPHNSPGGSPSCGRLLSASLPQVGLGVVITAYVPGCDVQCGVGCSSCGRYSRGSIVVDTCQFLREAVG